MQIISSSYPTALITGASRRLGLGFAVARGLAEQGYHVILTARVAQQAEYLACELCDAGMSATALRLDLADRSSIDALPGSIISMCL